MRVARLSILAATLIGLGAIAPSCGNGSETDWANAPFQSTDTAAFEATVDIVDSRYRPSKVRVLVGGSVTWINRDPDRSHTAETRDPAYKTLTGGTDQSWDTHALTWNEPYTVLFHKPGTYTYFCSLDPRMSGEVEVIVREPPK